MEKLPLKLLSLLLLIALYGCDISPKDETIVTSGGLVNKGILSEAIAKAYKPGSDEPIKQVYTRTDGTFSLEDVNFEGSLYIVVTTSSQSLVTCDGADGCGNFPGGLKLAGESDDNLNGRIDFGDRYFYNNDNFILSAYIQSSESNKNRFAVTPLTHIAAAAVRKSGNVNEENIQRVNAQIAELFGLDGTDISRTVPPDITNEPQMQAATQVQRMYAALSAAVASAADSDTDVSDVINDLATDFVEQGGLIANSTDPNKVTLATIQQFATEVATVVEQELSGVDMSAVFDKAQQELNEQLALPPDTLVVPSTNPSTSPDFDGDGIPDSEEAGVGTDPLDADTDDDGLLDGKELSAGTNPLNSDTDGDGMFDGWEVFYELDPLDPADKDQDPDADGLINIDEFTFGSNPNNSDTDGDGLNDGTEVGTHGTSPTSFDTDGDGLNDFEEINTYQTDPTDADSDNDGMGDGWEVSFNLNPLNSADAFDDFDEDGLYNKFEHLLGTNPNAFDTDGDGISDGDEDFDNDLMPNFFEVNFGLDPFVDDGGQDLDGDSYSNYVEFEEGSDPTVPNPTIEFVSDAGLYDAGSSSPFEIRLDESAIMGQANDLADRTFLDNVSGGTTTDDNENQDIIFHNLNSDKYGLPIRQYSDGTSLITSDSSLQAVTPDGFFVLFRTNASDNTVSGDTNQGEIDLFVYDRVFNESFRVGSNAQVNGTALEGDITADGNTVILEADNYLDFGLNDTNSSNDVYTYKMSTATPTLVSRNHESNDSANGSSGNPDISADGLRIVFGSGASNIIDSGASDGNGSGDVYFYNAQNGDYFRISKTVDESEDDSSTPPMADYPVISANGKALVYVTQKDILDKVGAATPSYQQIYYVDLDRVIAGDTVGQYTTLITQSWDGSNNGFGDSFIDPMTIRISADGQHVYYKSASQNLSPVDSNGASIDDLFVWDRSTNQNYLLSQFVYGSNGSALNFDYDPGSNHTNGMGIQNFVVNAEESALYLILDNGHEYTDIPAAATACTSPTSYCVYRLKIFMPQSDTDNDGLNDRAEATAFTDPNNADSDNDGLTDGAEIFQHKTSPTRPDTDDDGINDGSEISGGSDPLDPDDPNPPM